MSELTAEEKSKIYEEEKTRLEAQEKIKKEKKAKNTKKKWAVLIGLIIVMVVIEISGDKTKTPSEPLYVDLKATVKFDGTQFIITNNDSFNWTGVKLEINSGLIKGGYSLRHGLMVAGQTYTVGSMQFAKSDGERFNPFSMKPKNVTITCDTPQGRGFYTAEWE